MSMKGVNAGPCKVGAQFDCVGFIGLGLALGQSDLFIEGAP